MKKNNHLIVILLVLTIMISLVYVYISSKYSGSNKTSTNSFVAQNNLTNEKDTIDTNNISEEENNTADINVGDNAGGIAHCAKVRYYCTTGTLVGGNCVTISVSRGKGPAECTSSSGGNSWSNGVCYSYTKIGAPKKECTTCEDYYYLSNGYCKQCYITSATADRSVVSPGAKWYAKVLSYTPGSEGNKCPLPQMTTEGIASNDYCGYTSITIKYGSTTKTVSVRVAGDWQTVEDGIFDHNMEATSRQAADGKDYYVAITDADGNVVGQEIVINNETVAMEHGRCKEVAEGWYCKNVEQRGMCGSKGQKAYSYCCVNNQYVGVSDSVKWADHVLVNYDAKKDGKLGCAYYYGDDYTYANVTQDKCKVTDNIPGRCTSSSVNVNKVNEKTTGCEVNHKITLYEGEKCTGNDLGTEGNNIKTTFYSVSCTREVNANFDYGDDGITTTSRELYRGQGFKYGITITSKVKCDGEFYGDRWKNVYKKLWEKVKNVDTGLENACKVFDKKGLENCEAYIKKMKFNKVNTKKDVFELLTIIRELVDIVDTYNNYVPNTNFDEEATINFSYTINGKKGVAKVDDVFSKTVVDKGSYVATSEKTVNLGVSGITNPKTYSRSNYSKPRKVKFILKKVYIDKTDGAVKANPKQKIDGGNKIYIDYNADAQVISVNSMSIIVNGVTGNNSSITNDKCTINIKDQDLLYRPIDVSNPFINNDWEKGNNWSNSQFDFTKVIHDDVWLGDDCYSIYSNGTWGKCKG